MVKDATFVPRGHTRASLAQVPVSLVNLVNPHLSTLLFVRMIVCNFLAMRPLMPLSLAMILIARYVLLLFPQDCKQWAFGNISARIIRYTQVSFLVLLQAQELFLIDVGFITPEEII